MNEDFRGQGAKGMLVDMGVRENDFRGRRVSRGQMWSWEHTGPTPVCTCEVCGLALHTRGWDQGCG